MTALTDDANNLIGITGAAYTNTYTDCSFVFEFVPLNSTAVFSTAPQFDQVVSTQGFAPVDAISTLEVSANNFSRLFYIISDDVDTLETQTNMSYGIIGTNVSNPGYNPFEEGNISFSHAMIHAGFANPAAEFKFNTSLYQDYIRYTAKRITGGYALSDIFDNETELLTGVVSLDSSFNDAFYTNLNNASACESIEDNFANAPEFEPYLRSCQTLVANLLKDATNNPTNENTSSYVRGQRFLQDLKDQSDARSAEEVALGEPNTSGFGTHQYWVLFHPGDVLAVRLNYEPGNGSGAPAVDSNGDNLGSNFLYDRSYKVYLRMTE